jgi:competence protein ComEC
LHYFALATISLVASSVWFGENLYSFGRLCLVLAVGVVLIVLAQMAQVRPWLVLLLCLTSCLTCWRSHIEWQNVQDVRSGNYSGLAILKSDPQPIGRGVRVVFEIEGQRFESWLYGSSARRVALHVSGESVEVVGQRRPNGEGGRRLQVRHIVGRFEVKVLRTIASGAHISESRFELAANRVRSALGKGSRVLSGDQSALFAGLVYGDDSQQPPEMVDRFRASGLAHLTAVSGQNVAFVMAVVAPLLTRLRRWNRLLLTLLVLGWFAIMTRLEPSVIRAVTMAGITATVFAIGGRLKAWQVLCATCISLLVLDPFLLWSVGWWLSIGGSSGLIVLSPRIRTSLQCWGLRNHPWVVDWVAPSLAAQLGVLPILVLVFGWPSAMSIPCNLLAVPIAGLVMLAGIPTALIAGVTPQAISEALMWPLGVGVKWVDTVAALGQHLNLPPVVDIATAVVPLFLLLSHRCENLET